MASRYLLILLGVVLIAIGVVERGWSLLAVWLGADFLALGIAYTLGFHRLFGKRPDGSLPFWSWLVFLPYLLYSSAVWQTLRLVRRESPYNMVSDDLVIGRRLVQSEVQGEFANYVDLTAEFQERRPIRKSPGYLSFPILDGAPPDSKSLQDFINRLRPGRTFIHCAQGHGRTASFTVALLLKSGADRTAAEALEKLKRVRPGIRLSAAQLKWIKEFEPAVSG